MMMQGEAYSWIGVLAVAPVVMVLTAWFLVLLHGYKNKWGSVDVFLAGLFSQQLVTVLLAFLWTVLELVHPTIVPELCGTLLWAFISIRTLHLATLASLSVDRTLTIMWPYRYRLSVRKSQVKYHLFVLMLLATFVGVAAVFARKEAQFPCSFLPHTLETKFSIFSICLQTLLLLVTVGCTVVVQCHVCTLPDTVVTQAPSDLAPLGGHSGSNTSTTSSSVSRLQQRPQSVIADDFRGTTLSVIALFCCMLDYLPHIAMTVLDQFWKEYLPPWPLENLSIWIYVGEGLLVPVLAALADPSLNMSLKKALSKDPTRISQYTTHSGLRHDDGRFRVFPRDLQDVKFPITNGSLVSNFVPTINSASRLPHFNPNYHRKSNPATKLGVSRQDGKGTAGKQQRSPFYTFSQEQDKSHKDHIYATLSETYGSNSTLEEGFLSDEPCNSLTTVANDDFVFHNVRPSAMAQNQKQRPRNLKENTTQTTPKANPRKCKHPSKRATATETEQECIRELIYRLHGNNSGYDNPGFEGDTLGRNKNHVMKVYKAPLSQNKSEKTHHKTIIPSLSLNAIDSIDDINVNLPTKSESTLSLYRSSYEDQKKGKEFHGGRHKPRREGERYVRKGKKGAKRGTGGVNSLVGRMQRGNSVVSMQSLFNQLDGRGAVSDTGEFLPVHSSSSLPDFKTIFISDYI